MADGKERRMSVLTQLPSFLLAHTPETMLPSCVLRISGSSVTPGGLGALGPSSLVATTETGAT